MGATFETLHALDEDLVAKGHHPLTGWWRSSFRALYGHPTARTLVARVGRGGSKSHAATKFALNETLFGDWAIPPGERHFWAVCSTSKDEAAQRLTLIERFLLDLGLKYTRDGDQIVLVDQPRGWRVFAATIGAVSGFRCFGYTGDELCKWKAADRFVNPAAEVCASMAAMTVTHPGARRLLVSSPMGMTDFHFKRFELGDTADQLVRQAPTWVANPSVTKEQTIELEPDERIWRREYAAQPQAGALSVFEPEAIARAFAWPGPLGAAIGDVGVIDASSGKKDSWTHAICGWREVAGKRRFVVRKIDGVGGAFWAQKSGDAIVEAIATTLKSENIHVVHADQRESLMLRAAFQRHGVRFVEHPWTAPAKERAVATVRRWLADEMILLPEHEKLRDELLEFEERSTTAGAFTFGARGSGHDDFVALLLTAAMADAERQLAGSPSRRKTFTETLSEPGALDRAKAMLNGLGADHDLSRVLFR
jgi:hypothetical protein